MTWNPEICVFKQHGVNLVVFVMTIWWYTRLANIVLYGANLMLYGANLVVCAI